MRAGYGRNEMQTPVLLLCSSDGVFVNRNVIDKNEKCLTDTKYVDICVNKAL